MSETEKVLCPGCGKPMAPKQIPLDTGNYSSHEWVIAFRCKDCGWTGPVIRGTSWERVVERARTEALKRYKTTKAECKAAMKLEAGEHPMSYERVVQILMNEYECASRDGCDRACCAQCELVMNRIDVLTALSLAIHAIQTDILHEFEGEDDDKSTHAR